MSNVLADRRGIGLAARMFAVGALLILFAFGVYALFFYQPPVQVLPPAAPKYTKDLTVRFKLYDTTAGSLVTADARADFFAAGDNPFERYFAGTPVFSAAYDSVEGAWVAILDAGSYKLLFEDLASTKTKYPELIDVKVPGTSAEDRKVWLDPVMVNLVQRADVSIGTTIKAFDGTTWVTVNDINITAYDQWLVTFEFTVSGQNKAIKPGRLYLSKIDGLVPTEAYLDGQKVSIAEDTDASDDGMTGYYVTFSDAWKGGEIHRLDVYLSDQGAGTGTLTLTLFDYYACLNDNLVWWTRETASISVVS